MGGKNRLRISSQSLKRAWRTSDLFESALKGNLGVRTKRLGTEIFEALKKGTLLSDRLAGKDAPDARMKPVAEKNALKIAQSIAAVFGKVKKGDESLEIEQLMHFSPDEIKAIDDLLVKLSQTGKEPSEDEKELLMKKHSAVDIAMFGRMLADKPMYNVEAAAQVAHAITVHEVAVEDDYFTAVDDLNRGDVDQGAGHIGETEFAAGLFYMYLCINRDLCVENLKGDAALTKRGIQALIETAAKVGPAGKQATFASRAYASYILAERGSQQPRSLSVAFLKPAGNGDMLDGAITAINDTRTKMDAVYGKTSDGIYEVNALAGKGTLTDLIKFATKDHV
jgi:CRISPR system Cascade subunit CasC